MSDRASSPPPTSGPPLAKGSSEPSRAVPERVSRAWRAWLTSLATDADAAIAAAHVYAELPPEAREAWLDALAEDGPEVGVPGAALYGPLLAVEADPTRAARMQRQLGWALELGTRPSRALCGTGADGARVVVLVIPQYLDFVRVVACRFSSQGGFVWAHQLPIAAAGDAPSPGQQLDGVELRRINPQAAVDELAHAVVAQVRSGRPLPQLLRDVAALFSVQRDGTTGGGG
jgi:hypothetical protein